MLGFIAFSLTSEPNISVLDPMKSTLKSDWSMRLKELGTLPAIVSTWLVRFAAALLDAEVFF